MGLILAKCFIQWGGAALIGISSSRLRLPEYLSFSMCLVGALAWSAVCQWVFW